MSVHIGPASPLLCSLKNFGKSATSFRSKRRWVPLATPPTSVISEINGSPVFSINGASSTPETEHLSSQSSSSCPSLYWRSGSFSLLDAMDFLELPPSSLFEECDPDSSFLDFSATPKKSAHPLTPVSDSIHIPVYRKGCHPICPCKQQEDSFGKKLDYQLYQLSDGDDVDNIEDERGLDPGDRKILFPSSEHHKRETCFPKWNPIGSEKGQKPQFAYRKRGLGKDMCNEDLWLDEHNPFLPTGLPMNLEVEFGSFLEFDLPHTEQLCLPSPPMHSVLPLFSDPGVGLGIILGGRPRRRSSLS